MKGNAFAAVLYLTINYSFAQNIYGDWMKIDAVNVNKQYHTNVYSIPVIGYEQLLIKRDTIEISNSPIDKARIYKFRMNDTILDFAPKKCTYKIINDTLWLIDNFRSNGINTQPMKYTYVRLDKLTENNTNSFSNSTIEVVLDTFIISNSRKGRVELNDPGISFDYYHSKPQLFLQNKKYHFRIPKFIGDMGDFGKFIQDNIDYTFKPNGTENYVFALISILINSKSKIVEVKIEYGNNDGYNRKLLKLFNHRNNIWKQTYEEDYVKLIFPIKFIQDKGEAFSSNEAFQKGNYFFERKNYEKAIEKYTRAICFNNTNIDAYFNRAAVDFELGQINNACYDWNKIYRLGKNDSYDLLKQYCTKENYGQ